MLLDKLKGIKPKLLDQKFVQTKIKTQSLEKIQDAEDRLKNTDNPDDVKRLKNQKVIYETISVIEEVVTVISTLIEDITKVFGEDFEIKKGLTFKNSILVPFERIYKSLFKYNTKSLKFEKDKNDNLVLNIDPNEIDTILAIRDNIKDICNSLLFIQENYSERKESSTKITEFLEKVKEQLDETLDLKETIEIRDYKGSLVEVSLGGLKKITTSFLKDINSKAITNNLENAKKFVKNNSDLYKRLKALNQKNLKEAKSIYLDTKLLIEERIPDDSEMKKVIILQKLEENKDNLALVKKISESTMQGLMIEEWKQPLEIELEKLEKKLSLLEKSSDDEELEELRKELNNIYSKKQNYFEKVFQVVKR